MRILYTILICFTVYLSVSCASTIDPPTEELGELELIASYPLEISDPSGLTLDLSGEFLWTVSDSTGDHVYKGAATSIGM